MSQIAPHAPAVSLHLPDDEATNHLGQCLARSLPSLKQAGALVALEGDLGTGKTALVRAMLRALGVAGTIRSPTYTLLEPYELDGIQAMHMDLYRLADPEELEFLGVREFDAANQLLLIEWPALGAGFLPKSDLEVALSHPNARNTSGGNQPAETGRMVTVKSQSSLGDQWIADLERDIKVNNNLKKEP